MQHFPTIKRVQNEEEERKYPWRSYPPFWIWFFSFCNSLLVQIHRFFFSFFFRWCISIQSSIRGACTLFSLECDLYACMCLYGEVVRAILCVRKCCYVEFKQCNTYTKHDTTNNISNFVQINETPLEHEGLFELVHIWYWFYLLFSFLLLNCLSFFGFKPKHLHYAKDSFIIVPLCVYYHHTPYFLSVIEYTAVMTTHNIYIIYIKINMENPPWS